MNHIHTDDIVVGTGSSVFVFIKLLFFSDATYHFSLVGFDAFVAGIVGLLVMHYGKKACTKIDSWIVKKIKKMFP